MTLHNSIVLKLDEQITIRSGVKNINFNRNIRCFVKLSPFELVMSRSEVIVCVACVLIGNVTAQGDFLSGPLNMAGSFAEGGFGSFASSGFGLSNFGGSLLENVPGSNFVGSMVTSTTNADGVTEITHKVTDGVVSEVEKAGHLPDSKLPIVNDVVGKVVPEVIEQVTEDLNKGVEVEKIVDNVVDTVGNVVDDANLGKVVGPLLLKILTNRATLRAMIRVLILVIRLGLL